MPVCPAWCQGRLRSAQFSAGGRGHPELCLRVPAPRAARWCRCRGEGVRGQWVPLPAAPRQAALTQAERACSGRQAGCGAWSPALSLHRAHVPAPSPRLSTEPTSAPSSQPSTECPSRCGAVRGCRWWFLGRVAEELQSEFRPRWGVSGLGAEPCTVPNAFHVMSLMVNHLPKLCSASRLCPLGHCLTPR